MKGKMKVIAVTAALVVLSGSANAGPVYEWVCDLADCGGDTAFTSSMEISSSAFAAGDFTGVTGNILSWTTTSGVGAGYTLTLPTMLNGIGPTADQTNVRIVLSSDKSEISQLLDVSSGTNISFFDSTIGRVDFFEGANYSVGALQDSAMIAAGEFANIRITGRFVRSVPEPDTLLLLAAGLFVLGFVRHRLPAHV